MKVIPRNTVTRIIAKRITAPETKPDPETGKRIVLLSYIDAGSYQRHCPTTVDLFVYAAGNNEVGEVQNGLDRLMHHRYIIHMNDREKAIGLDIIPDRLYRSGVIPKSQLDVTTLVIRYEVGGAVARVVQRPFNTRFEQSAAVIQVIDRLVAAGKAITQGMRLGDLGRVVSVTENSVEVKLGSATKGRTDIPELTSDEDIHEQEDAQAPV